MSQKFKQHDKRFRIATLLGEEQLHLRSLQGEELLSGLFHFRLEMVSEDLRLDFRRLVGKPLTLTMELAEGERRHVNGIVSRFVQSGGFEQDGAFFTTYHADLHPTLWFLTLGRDCRIFQQKTVPEILEAVLDAHGVTDRELKLNGQYEPRDYCVQYGESPFAFLSRLMEEEGIFYYFVHEFDKHTLVIADDPAVFVPGPGAESLRCGTLKSAQTLNLVPRCSLEERVIPGSFYVDDFSFETPYTDLLAREQSALPWSEGRSLVYEYPGRFTKKDEGERLARMRIEELEAQAKVLSGDCLSPSLSAGHRFTLEEHYRDDVNGPYVLQKVTHTATSGEYTNRFEAFPATAPFKPPRRTRK
ncbi:MAG: type VI secretion system tip protein VgrG, partial [Acidobacteria bacterium]|nr:type VI secretion system tip protein VgrG [Acidobacteriota bacterium]